MTGVSTGFLEFVRDRSTFVQFCAASDTSDKENRSIPPPLLRLLLIHLSFILTCRMPARPRRLRCVVGTSCTSISQCFRNARIPSTDEWLEDCQAHPEEAHG